MQDATPHPYFRRCAERGQRILRLSNLARIDDDFNRRADRVFLIEVQRAVYVFEMSAQLSDHHVPGTKFSGGMSRFERPLAIVSKFHCYNSAYCRSVFNAPPQEMT